MIIEFLITNCDLFLKNLSIHQMAIKRFSGEFTKLVHETKSVKSRNICDQEF